MTVEVRQALPEDEALCFSITKDAMRRYVEATWGKWEEKSQRRLHAESFEPSTHWLVFTAGTAAGLVAAEVHSTHLQLVKLYLRSPYRGRGVGSVVLASLLTAARIRSQPIRLRVLAVNTRAQAFYARHGFAETSRTRERVFMAATPNPSFNRTYRGIAPWPARP